MFHLLRRNTDLSLSMANERSSSRMSAFPVTIFSHVVAVSILTLVVCWLLKLREGIAFSSSMKIQIFNLHPLLALLFVIFSGEAIVTYSGIHAPNQVLKLIHLILHVIALLVAVLGIYAVFKFHNELKYAHMYTLHSWIGLSAIFLFGLQFILGFVIFLFPGAKTATRARFSRWHIFAGVIIFFMAILTAETGLIEEFMYQKLEKGQVAHVINFIGLMILIYGIAVVLIVVLSLQRK